MEAMNLPGADWRLPAIIGLLASLAAASLLYTPAAVILIAAVPAALYYGSRPYQLLLLMVFLIPFNFVFKIGPFPAAVELLKVVVWIPFLLNRESGSTAFKTSRHQWSFAVLGALLLLSLARSQDLPFTLKESLRLASNMGLCYLAINLIDTRERLLQVFKVLTVSTFLVACYGFYQFAIQDFGALFWIVNPRLDTSLSHGRDVFWEWRNRITSVLTSEMELGHYFNMCLPVGVYLWLTAGRKRVLSPWLWATVATFAGLVLTFTFGAWLALAGTAFGFILFFQKNHRWKMMAAGVLVVALAAALITFGPLRPFVESKMSGEGMGSLAWDAYTRLASWSLALQAWKSHPLIGIGYGNFPRLSLEHLDFLVEAWTASGSSPHDIYLYLLSEMGLLGLAAVVVILARTLNGLRKVRGTPELGWIAMALLFSLSAGFVGGLSDDSPFYGPHASYLIWLFIGMSESVVDLAAPLLVAASPSFSS